MGYWNEDYTRKKQKQMLRDAVERERQQSPTTTPRPLYREYYSSPRSNDWIRQKEKERRFWIFGGVIIGIVFIAGIFSIIWAAGL